MGSRGCAPWEHIVVWGSMKKGESGQVYAGEKPLYEVSFLISASVPEDSVASEVATINSLLAEAEGEILFAEAPKMRALSYPMLKTHLGKREKFDSAYFGSLIVALEGEKVKVLPKQLESMPSVLRALVVAVPPEALWYAEKRVAAKAEREAKHAALKEEANTLSQAELDKTIEQLVIE